MAGGARCGGGGGSAAWWQGTVGLVSRMCCGRGRGGSVHRIPSGRVHGGVAVLLGEHALQGVVLGRVVAEIGVPAGPDDVRPGPCEDADGVGVVMAAFGGTVVEVGCPGVVVAGVAGEVTDGVAQLFIGSPWVKARARR